ncbi:MAG: RagB/SusD family nutrient uptake outer membrane protein [Bacteroidales bacterium]|nr:RagB/SusD family nutrient uptake outer membrane protein [Bacteroidales bacterium]
MKKIQYIFIIPLFVVLNSCSDFLNTQPLSFTSISNFYTNQDDAELALTGCYGQIGSSYAVNYRTGLFLIGDVGTDEIIGNPYAKPDAESNMDQFIFGRVMKNNLNVKNLWARMYSGLYSINLLLSKIDAIPMDTTRRNQIKAEAMFLRGWHYMYLGMTFGGVPVYTGVPQDMTKGRNTLQDVMTQSTHDFQYAYAHLSNNKLVNSGRATKWAAGGYLSKLYCYLASSKKFEVGKNLNFPLNSFDWVDVDDCYRKADTLTESIVSKSGLKLTSDYRLLFCEGSVNKQKEECLFSLTPSPQKKIGLSLNYYLLPTGAVLGGGWGTCRPTQEVYSRYDTLYDVRPHWVVGGLSVDKVVETIDNQSYYKPSKLVLSKGEATGGDYCVNKFRILKTESKHEDVYYGYYPLLRLADIYLLRAEALAHLNGDEAGREILKIVRTRALITSRTTDVTKLQTTYRRTDFVQELLDERSRELCFEQQRKFDLVRFNRYESTIKSISTTFGIWNKNAAQQLIDNISDTKIWCPIPEEDEIANPNLKPNNPGY